MKHVPSHRWADAFAGLVSDEERAVMDGHAERCDKCRRIRQRVRCASDTFPVIKTQTAPELPWDSVRARVHWAVSKEKRERGVQPRSRRAWSLGVLGALGVAAAAAGAIVLFDDRDERTDVVAIAHDPPRPRDPALPAVTPPVSLTGLTALTGLVNRTSGEVMIDGVRPDDLFTRRLVAGNVIATGDGRVDVQFGHASAFALGPRSTVELRHFDARSIELVVDGTIDLEVAPRAAGQRFVVIAGEHTVEVRGTQFRVKRAGDMTDVACRHGLVAVSGRNATSTVVEVAAARSVRIGAGETVARDRVRAMSVDEIDQLADASPMRLPLFDVDTLPVTSAPLEIATVGRREVRVDGVELGLAPLRVRVMPGRHTVEAADSQGRFRRAGWVDVAAPPSAKPARLDVQAEPPPTAGIAERRRQLRSGIDASALARCTRSIAKAGLSGTYVQVEISVDATGAVGFLNVLDTDLPSGTARCVRDVLADVRFGKGAPATWREKLDL